MCVSPETSDLDEVRAAVLAFASTLVSMKTGHDIEM
jgi:hypothetical protein